MKRLFRLKKHTRPTHTAPRTPRPIDDRYDALVRTMLERYQVRVRKWRSSMSGCAWEVHYDDGSVARLIEAPRPRGPMSAAVFLHEIGHHAIGVGAVSPRCLEEYEAWRWSLHELEAAGFRVTERVRERVHRSLVYAVDKARRRGLKHLPPQLIPYDRAGDFPRSRETRPHANIYRP